MPFNNCSASNTGASFVLNGRSVGPTILIDSLGTDWVVDGAPLHLAGMLTLPHTCGTRGALL